MKMLMLHASLLKYRITEKALEKPEDAPCPEESFKEALVVFTSVEEGDDEGVVRRAKEEVARQAREVGAERVVIYPYAHLSSDLAPPEASLVIIKELASALEGEGFEVHRTPFGWYKSFEVHVKGHPLSEAFREISAAEGVKKRREEVTASISHRYFIVSPKGEIAPVDLEGDLEEAGVLRENPALMKYIMAEEKGVKPGEEPPSIKSMRRLEIADYEEASDSGHFRFYPKGTFLLNTLKEWADSMARELEALEISTPLIYSWEREDIRGQTESFHERHYVVYGSDRRPFVLRFASDFGLFRMISEATLSFRNLPLRMYEYSMSFRLERRGELKGLKRLRAFHMPDIHSFTADLDMGWEEFERIFTLYLERTAETGVEFAVVFRVVEEFWESSKERITGLIRNSGVPAFVDVLSGMKHYWVIKSELQAIDSVGGNLQLATVQLDVEDSERYGITFTDRDGKEKGAIIVHCSIGSLERWIYAILEEAHKMEYPSLPLWLAPTQLRFIPVGEEHVEVCEQMANSLEGRIDIDDRNLSVGKRIRDASREWVNMIVVVGDREVESGILPVRFRSGKVEEMSLEDIQRLIYEEMEGFPYLPLPLPRRLSRRFTFTGSS